jgi:Homeodomain-like domain
MSEVMSTTELAGATPPDPEAVAIRQAIIGNRKTIKQIAAALDVTERTIYNIIDAHHVPYIKALGVRWLEPDDIRRALLGKLEPPPPRRGRPRKVTP